jgi:antitoxin CcdA
MRTIVRIVRIDHMHPSKSHISQRKGRMQLSISQDVLDRIEPLRDEVNFSAEAEQLFAAIAERVERQKWLARNSDALREHGKVIAQTGLAGVEFDRI